jgi:putative ABC transport system permease protein
LNLIESVRIALNSLLINRMRAALTTLGMVIGVGAVVGLVSLGDGVQRYVTDQFSGLGSNTLTVSSRIPTGGSARDVSPLTDEEAAQLNSASIAPSVAQVSTQYSVSGTVRYGRESIQTSITGVGVNYLSVNNRTMRAGMFFTADDLSSNARIAVLGEDTVEDLFGSKAFNPVGLQVQVSSRVFTVVGVLEPSGNSFSGETEFLVPITTAQTRLANARVQGGAYEVSTIQAIATSQDAVTVAMAEIEQYLMTARAILNSDEADFSVTNQATLLESIDAIMGMLTVFLALVAGISLLVGGIGIMNIMLVSVTERTREIGLRKAVGARGADILSQFLIESIILSFIGGALGVFVGWLITVIGGVLATDLDLYLTGTSILLATIVCSAIGIFFGLYPASRAAALRPIEALRFE